MLSDVTPQIGTDAGSRAPAVDRAIRILRALSDAGTPMGVNSIAREIGIMASTCYHVLRALEQEGFVEFDPIKKRYSIGLELVRLARYALHANFDSPETTAALVDIVKEFCVTGAVVQLMPRERSMIVAVERDSRPLGIQLEIGPRFPSYLSATGRCLAATSGLSCAQLRRRFSQLRWAAPPTFEEWMEQVETARRSGIGVDKGNFIKNYTIYSGPILKNGKMFRALMVITPQDQLRQSQASSLVQRLKTVSQSLST